jgi:hypothetical protein
MSPQTRASDLGNDNVTPAATLLCGTIARTIGLPSKMTSLRATYEKNASVYKDSSETP